MNCEKHNIQLGIYPLDECIVCVREERDRLREENDFLSHAMQQEIVGLGLLRDERDRLREERDRLRENLEEAKRLLCAAIAHGGSYFTVPYGDAARKVVES